jgi:hypothetical protein
VAIDTAAHKGAIANVVAAFEWVKRALSLDTIAFSLILFKTEWGLIGTAREAIQITPRPESRSEDSACILVYWVIS